MCIQPQVQPNLVFLANIAFALVAESVLQPAALHGQLQRYFSRAHLVWRFILVLHAGKCSGCEPRLQMPAIPPQFTQRSRRFAHLVACYQARGPLAATSTSATDYLPELYYPPFFGGKPSPFPWLAAMDPISSDASAVCSPRGPVGSIIVPRGDAVPVAPLHSPVSTPEAEGSGIPETSTPPQSARKPSTISNPAATPPTFTAAADGLSPSRSPSLIPDAPLATHADFACVLEAFSASQSAQSSLAPYSPAAGSLVFHSASEGLSPSRGYDGRHIFFTGDPPLAGSTCSAVTATHADCACVSGATILPSVCSLEQADPWLKRDMPFANTEDFSAIR